MPSATLVGAVFSGSLGGSVVAWIPGVSPSVAALAARLGAPSSAEEFLVSIAGVNSANALFSLVALYVSASPAAARLRPFSSSWTWIRALLVQMMIVAIIVAAASYMAASAARAWRPGPYPG